MAARSNSDREIPSSNPAGSNEACHGYRLQAGMACSVRLSQVDPTNNEQELESGLNSGLSATMARL